MSLKRNTPRRVLIVGATSAIAGETAKEFAKAGSHLFLTGRNSGRLATVANDLRVRGAVRVDTATLDVADLASHAPVIESAFASLGVIDAVLVAHGTLPDQERCQEEVQETVEALHLNFTATVALLTLVANRLESQQHGCLAVIGSVAGSRGRRTNYVYGAAKGGVEIFLQGLRSRLFQSNVTVLTVKPGFVDTPMTAGLKKNLLFADAGRIGHGIHRAIVRRKDVVYLPWFWRPIMGVLTSLPEIVLKRLPI
ncbi:MAG TPA: SDR family oxidoreductase [Gemmatimonadales bacterium]|nr:SDR family oxidoreductase [Gemmatimonadales bacterium]